MKRFLKSPYFQFGMTVVWVVCICILFSAILQNFDTVLSGLSRMTEILTPFIWGFVIAYLLLPMTRYFEYRMFNPLLTKLKKKEVPSGGMPRVVSIALALVGAGLMFYVLIRILLPTVYESVASIYTNYSVYLNNLTALINGLFENNPELASEVESMTRNLSDELANWINNELLPKILGPMMLPSICWMMKIISRNTGSFKGLTIRMMTAPGTAPMKGPKMGMMLVTPTMIAINAG